MSSQSSHHPQEVLLAQFSLYVHEGGLKPDSFHFFLFKSVIRKWIRTLQYKVPLIIFFYNNVLWLYTKLIYMGTQLQSLSRYNIQCKHENLDQNIPAMNSPSNNMTVMSTCSKYIPLWQWYNTNTTQKYLGLLINKILEEVLWIILTKVFWCPNSVETEY